MLLPFVRAVGCRWEIITCSIHATLSLIPGFERLYASLCVHLFMPKRPLHPFRIAVSSEDLSEEQGLVQTYLEFKQSLVFIPNSSTKCETPEDTITTGDSVFR